MFTYDGDTCTILLLIRRKVPFKIKLHMLDTPEKARCDDAEKQAGMAVAEYVKAVIHNSILDVEIKDWDKYGGVVFWDICTCLQTLRSPNTL